MPDFVIKAREKKEYEQFTCRIETELLDQVRKLVLENNLPSVNEFINDCIRFSVGNLKIMKETEEWMQKMKINGSRIILKEGHLN